MEALLTAFASMVSIISADFWLFVLLIAFLFSKDNRLGGYLILVTLITVGYHAWLIMIIIFFTLLTNFLNPRAYYKKEYEKRISEFQRNFHSNVINIRRDEED